MVGAADADESAGIDAERAAEKEMVTGLVSAIQAHGGTLPQAEIDRALGVGNPDAADVD